MKKQMDEIACLHREALSRAIDDERAKRLQAEKTVAEQSSKIHELGQSAYDKIQLECGKLRDFYEERMKVQQLESGKLRDSYEERIKLSHVESGKLRDSYEERIRAQEERERELRSTLSEMLVRKNKSTTKGTDGEAEADDLLHQIFPASEIEDLRSQGGRGDFLVVQDDVCMMVEVKNYKRNVAKTEVEKFMRDMRSNPGYTCGVIASLNSGVSGWNDFSLSCVDGRPVVFLHNVRDSPEKLQHAFSVFEMIHSIENLDLRRQSVLEAVEQEMVDKQRRNKALRALAEKHAAEVDAWLEIDETRAIATLKLLAGQSK